MDEIKPDPVPKMDQAYVVQNNIAAIYLAGQLPPRSATEFERYCRENPNLLDAAGLPASVNAGVRLLDVAGLKQPWDPEPLKFWQRLPVVIALATLAAAFALATRYYYNDAAAAYGHAAKLEKMLADDGSKAISGTDVIKIEPDRAGPNAKAQFAVDLGHGPKWLDVYINLAWNHAKRYRVTVERIGEGREMVVSNLLKDSNGELRLELNSSLLGSGSHRIVVDAQGLGAADLYPIAWSRFEVVRSKR